MSEGAIPNMDPSHVREAEMLLLALDKYENRADKHMMLAGNFLRYHAEGYKLGLLHGRRYQADADESALAMAIKEVRASFPIMRSTGKVS